MSGDQKESGANMQNILINILLLIAIIIILITQFILNDVPEWFDGGARLGEIFFNLSLSYIVSYIFYQIAFLPDKRTKRKIHDYILKQINDIIGQKSSVLSALQKETSINGDTIEDIRKITKLINPHSKSPLVLNSYINNEGKLEFIYANWAQFLVYHIDKSKETAQKLYPYMAIMDADIAVKVNNIMECSYFFVSDVFLRRISNFNNQDLSTMSDDIFEYFQLIHDLENETIKVKKKYRLL